MTATTAPAGKPRDLRLDFFRGLSLAVIFVAHVPGSVLYGWIWARFGLSDAAHVFVFISGFAAALAFGGTFVRQGFAVGTARILWRVVQLYCAHIALFVVGAALCAWAATRFQFDYAAVIGIHGFFADPAGRLLDLVALRYVPMFFDILPLYMVVLAGVPAAMALARLHPALVLAASAGLWLAVQLTGLSLDAGEDRRWGFNPFAWQLVFFTGFALARGWIRAPRPHPALVAGAAAMLAVGALAVVPGADAGVPALAAAAAWLLAQADKPNLDPLQYLHFLALAFLAVTLLKGREGLLDRALARPLVRMGGQALPVFFSGLALSHVANILMEAYGTGAAMQVAVNATGLAALYGVARMSAWIKAPPWKAARAPARDGAPAPRAAPGCWAPGLLAGSPHPAA